MRRIFSLVFISLLTIVPEFSGATPLTPHEERQFYARFQIECESEARKTGKGTKAQQNDWCVCANYETIKQLTKEDLEPSQHEKLMKKLGNSTEICRQKLLTPSGDFK